MGHAALLGEPAMAPGSNLAPFQGAGHLLAPNPGVSLRSTPGYGLASLRDGLSNENVARMDFAHPGMKRSTALRGGFAMLVALPLMTPGHRALWRASECEMKSGTPSGCWALRHFESGGVAVLNPRLRSGIPSGWTQRRKRGTNEFAHPRMKRSTARRRGFAMLVALALMSACVIVLHGEPASAKRDLAPLQGAGHFLRSESGGVAALNPRLRSGIPSGCIGDCNLHVI